MNFTLKPLAIAVNLIVLGSSAMALPALAFQSLTNTAQLIK